jgi:hypothetical protein
MHFIVENYALIRILIVGHFHPSVNNEILIMGHFCLNIHEIIC